MSPDDTSDFEVDESDEEGCGHAACLCAAGESGFCSDFCEQHADGDDSEEDEDDDEASCGCRHPDCAAQ